MNPAYSVIFFTTAAGTGYGLLALVCLFVPLSAAARPTTLLALALGTVLVTAGLLSSTFHLGHPERAWRALTQWRTSWLSREGVLAVLVYPPLLAVAALTWFAPATLLVAPWPTLLCGMVALLALATVYATGMIYASLRAVPTWCLQQVPLNYLLLALMGGAVLLSALQLPLPPALPYGLLVAAALGKTWYWHRINSLHAASPGEATGLASRGSVSVLSPPHTAANYLQKEMGYVLARKHAQKLRGIALLTLCGLPLLCLAAGGLWPWLGVASMALGLVVERWLFFAEARHVVMGYYGG